MIQRFFFSYLLMNLTFFLAAQEDFGARSAVSGMQIGISDAKMIDQLMATIPGIGGSAKEMMRRQSIKPYLMPVRKANTQGMELSYLLASALEYYINLGTNYKENLSPDYITLNLNASGKPLTAPEGFGFLTQDGTVSAAILPFDSRVITSAVHATTKHRIKNYLHIYSELTPGRQKSFESRKALMRGNPILIELMADGTFPYLNYSVWKPQAEVNTAFYALVVGYDEDKEAFEIQSCWGSQWADNGYAWVGYAEFEKYVRNGYVIVPEP